MVMYSYKGLRSDDTYTGPLCDQNYTVHERQAPDIHFYLSHLVSPWIGTGCCINLISPPACFPSLPPVFNSDEDTA